MRDADFDHDLDRELRRLPTPRAPVTLLPRVLEATRRRPATPWHARGWADWPRAWQVASAAALAAVVVAGGLLAPSVHDAAGAAAARLGLHSAWRVTTLVDAVRQASVLLRVTWRLLLEPACVALLVLSVPVLLAGAALWSALDRVAVGEVHQS